MNDFLKKLFEKNSKNLNFIIFLIIMGIAIMAFSGFFTKNENTNSSKKAQDYQGANENIAELESRLAGILSQISGAGKVSVMISYSTTAQKQIAYDTDSSQNKKNPNAEIFEEEKTLQKNAVLSQNLPIILWESYPTIRGVIVTAEGGNNDVIRNNIITAVMAVLDVPLHKVAVMAKNQK